MLQTQDAVWQAQGNNRARGEVLANYGRGIVDLVSVLVVDVFAVFTSIFFWNVFPPKLAARNVPTNMDSAQKDQTLSVILQLLCNPQ